MMNEKSIVLKPAQRRKIEKKSEYFFFSLSNSRINSFNIAGDEKLTYSLIQWMNNKINYAYH